MEISLPAIGQGALGIETRMNDEAVEEKVRFLDDPASSVAIRAERAFLRRLQADVRFPLAVSARRSAPTSESKGWLGPSMGSNSSGTTSRGPQRTPNSWASSWQTSS